MIFSTPALGPEERAALATIEGVRNQLRYAVGQPRRWVGSVRRVLAARAIQGSNTIEGYNVSVEDALAAIDGDDLPDAERLQDQHAVAGYRRAMTYVINLADDTYFSYTSALIRSLHFMITEHNLDASPGRWRPGPIWVRNDLTGDVVYQAPEADEVPSLVAELVTELDHDASTPALVRAAMAHLNLVMIHPFRDGNGRMSRCLQTLVLARERILPAAFSSIEEYLGRNTSRYYEVLAAVGRGAWNPGGDARQWVRFCLEAHYVQVESVLRRTNEAAAIWGALDSLVEERHLPDRTLSALFDATIGLRVRNASYRAQLASSGTQISNQSATTDLRQMVEAGLLDRRGERRGASYTGSEELRRVRAEARRERKPIDTSRLFDPTME